MTDIKKIKKYFLIVLVCVFVYLIIDFILFNLKPQIKKLNTVRINYIVTDYDKTKKSNFDVFSTYGDAIVYMYTSTVELKKENGYYTTTAKDINVSFFENVVNSTFALNDVEGNVIKDASYDKKTRKIKIPSKYFSAKNMKNYNGVPVKLELISRVKKDKYTYNKIPLKMKKLISTKKYVYTNRYNDYPEFSIFKYKKGKYINESDFKIYINGNKEPVSKKLYSYDRKTGVVKLKFYPYYINNIEVKFSKMSLVKNKLFSILFFYKDVEAAKKVKATTTFTSTANKKTGSFLVNDTTTATVEYYYRHGDGTYRYGNGSSVTDVASSATIEGIFDNAIGVSDSEPSAYQDFAVKVGTLTFSKNFTYEVCDDNGENCETKNGTAKLTVAIDKWLLMWCYHTGAKTDVNGNLKIKFKIKSYSGGVYTISAEATEAVANQTAKGEFDVVGDNPASLTIQKKMNDTGTPTNSSTSSIVFRLYKEDVRSTDPQKGCKGLIAQKVTNGSGKAVFNGLKANTSYCIKEIFQESSSNSVLKMVDYYRDASCDGVPATEYNHNDGDKVKIVTTGAAGTNVGSDGSVGYCNVTKRYTTAIKKVDADTGANLAGFTFGLKNTAYSTVTDGNGYGQICGIPTYQSYVFTENAQAAEYWGSTGEVTVNAPKYEYGGQGSGEWLPDYDGTNTNTAYNTILHPYPISAACPSVLGQETGTFQNTHKFYCIKIKKVDADDESKLLSGATFQADGTGVSLTRNSQMSYQGTSPKTAYRESNGITTILTADHNEAFKITETGAPAGYAKSSQTPYATPTLISTSKKWSEIDFSDCDTYLSDSSSSVITMKNTSLNINWYKVSEYNNTKITDAQFKVKKGSAIIYHEADKKLTTDSSGTQRMCYVASATSTGDGSDIFVADSDGQVCVRGVEEGNYTVTETKSGMYHTFGKSTSKNITASGTFESRDDTESLSNKFINLRTEFEFTKSVSSGDGVWENITTAQLKKIPFNITDSNGNVITFIQKTGSLYEYAIQDNNGTWTTIHGDTGTAVTDLYLNDARKFKIVHLPVGTYNVKEKKACCDSLCPSCTGTEECTGFYYPNYSQASDYQFTINECSNSTLTSGSCSTVGLATKNLVNKPTEIKFTKKDLYDYADATSSVKFEDESERTAFDDIVFKLKDADGNYVSLVKVANHGNCKTDDSYAEYRYVPSGILGGIEPEEELHTCGGHIRITHLCRGKKYTIEEVSVPDNTVFTLPDEHIFKDYYLPYNEDGTACCDSPSGNPNTTTTIEDTPTRISIQKTNNRLNESIKEGDSKTDSYDNKYEGKFKVYKCSKDVTTCTYDLSDKKAIKFLNLETIENDREDPGEKVYKYVLDQSVTGGYIQELKLNSNGKLILRYLPANYKYVVVEENAPAGYYNLNPSSNALANLEVANAKNTTNKSYNFVNYPTIIEFDKGDIYKYYKSSDLDKVSSNNKMFDSMTFKLRDYRGNIVKLQKVTDGDYRFVQSDGNVSSNTVTELHTKDGHMIITNLYRDQTYYLEETKADTKGNFILPNNIDNTSLISSDAGDFKNNKHPVVKYDIPKNMSDETKKNSAPLSLTKLINNLPTRVVFEKRDKRTNELIDDEKNMILNEGKTDTDNERINYGNVRTTFNVYYCEKTSDDDTSPCEVDESRKVYFKERQYIKDENENDLTSDLAPTNENGNSDPTSPFLVYEYSKLNDSTDAVGDLITDRGLLVLAYLPSNYKYVLYEKIAPNGYYQPDSTDKNLKIQFRVEEGSLENGKTYTNLTSINENTPTEIMFIKSDFYDYYDENDIANLNAEVKLFDTARFVLRDAEGNKLKLKKVETNEDEGNVYRYLPINDSNTEEQIYTYKGKLKITHLYRNSTYYIEEVKTTDPKHFILPDYMQFENLPFDNKGHPVVKYVVPKSKPSDAITVTKEIENIPTRVRFEKRDSKYNYLIPDEAATFKVYQCKKDDDGNSTDCHPTDENDENSVLMTFTERHVLSGTDMYGVTHNDQEDPKDAEGLDGVEVYTYAKLNEGTVTDLHPYHGILVLRYLPAGYDYVLVETAAPKNYVLPKGTDAETKFTVVDNTVYVDPNDVPNTPTGIIIKKYHENSDQLLAGAEFRIYRSETKCNFNQNPWAQINLTPVKLKTIRDGVYEARPETDTETVRTCLDKEGALCTDVSTNLSSSSEMFLTDDEYRDSYADFSNMVVKENIETDKKLTIHEGEALVQYLEYGHCYVIEETKAPTGYSLPKKKKDRFTMIQIDENEQYAHDTQNAFKNFPTPFTFFKYDEFNQPLDGAEFKLQKLNDDKKYEDIAVTEEEKEGELFYKYEGLAEENSNTVMHTNGGKATVYYLPVGQYRIVETKAAPGKELTKNPNIATFFVDDAGNTFGNALVVNKAETKKIIPKNSASAELIVNIQTGQVVIRYGVIIMSIITLIIGLIFIKKKMD